LESIKGIIFSGGIALEIEELIGNGGKRPRREELQKMPQNY
jgi:hypothetical protein